MFVRTRIVGACVAGAVAVLSFAGAPRDRTAELVGIALVESEAYETLEYLCDRIGHRLSGSEGLEKAVRWTTEKLQRDGIPRVWNEKVMVPHWERGEARAAIVSPARRDMALLALGGSVGTGADGVRGAVVAVDSLEALEELGDEVRGKIVLFNRPIARNGEGGASYGAGSRLRVAGPSVAAKQGAVATLIRSLGTADYRLPHTGMLRYAEDAPRIPAAAVSTEDAMRIERLLENGENVEVELFLGCRTHPDAESANVIADLPGREKPEEIVLIGCHLDSWDVGDGAIDDGAGCVIVMETLRLLHANGLVPRRTIRGVLFTNEENGLRGGRSYAEKHEDEMPLHVAAIESDLGAGSPRGYGVSAGEGGVAIVEKIARHLEIIDADEVTPRGGGADISPMRKYGVPQIGLRQDPTYYFDYHHTTADTFDKIDRDDLDRNVAAMMLLAYMLADAEETLPRLPVEED